LIVDSYEDEAVGHLAKNAAGKLAVTRIELRPKIAFAAPVDAETLSALHHRAHEECFIANSVTTEIVVVEA
jgi:organic hydroperoxide reductase OsmC/OhrA